MFGKSTETEAQRQAAARQEEELAKLKGIEAKKVAAAQRRTRGRASLISGAETGVQGTQDTLG